jgi:hypothetical protein
LFTYAKGTQLTDNDRKTSRRTRLAAGLGIVAVSLLIATAIVGVGFAGGSISAAQYQYGKVTICHHTHSKKHPTVTITISQRAWPAHQRHGDTQGACPPPAPSTNGHHGHGKGNSNGSTTTTSSTTPTAPTHGHSGDDHGSSNGHHK